MLSLISWPFALCALGGNSSYPQGALHWFLLVCVSMEFSSPFVQIRWFLSAWGYRQDPIYLVNGLLMTFSFILCRIIIAPFLCWAIYFAEPYHYEKSGYLDPLRWLSWWLYLPTLLNIFWTYQLVNGILNVSKAKNE